MRDGENASLSLKERRWCLHASRLPAPPRSPLAAPERERECEWDSERVREAPSAAAAAAAAAAVDGAAVAGGRSRAAATGTAVLRCPLLAWVVGGAASTCTRTTRC